MSEELKAMTDQEINKVCAEIMGKKQHEWAIDPQHSPRVEGSYGNCSCGWRGLYKSLDHHIDNVNFNPISIKQDAYDLIQFVVNEWDKKKRNKFYSWVMDKLDKREITSFVELFEYLFSNQRVLPEALARHLKEEGK